MLDKRVCCIKRYIDQEQGAWRSGRWNFGLMNGEVEIVCGGGGKRGQRREGEWKNMISRNL